MTTAQKLTTQNQKIYDLLCNTVRPVSAYEILHKLRQKGVRSPPTVYRALEKLQEMGLVHRVESLGAFVACRHQDDKHHDSCSPFAICTTCGDVRELKDPALVRAMKKMGDNFLAQIDHKIFEVSGLCRDCQNKNGKEGSGHV